VLIHYGANGDPTRWGYPLLGMSYPAELARGFPVIQAEVDYPAEGYAAILAWIQLVWVKDLDGGEPTYQPADLAPQLLGLDMPYFSFGVRPVLFDAPSYGIAECRLGRAQHAGLHAGLPDDPGGTASARLLLGLSPTRPGSSRTRT
jgi:hypothetical protein